MGFLYPDNQNRANRVQQLAADISHLQTQIKEDVEDAMTQDKRAVAILDKIAKDRGYSTLDEFVEEARKKLSPEDKKKYEDMKEGFEKVGHNIDMGMKLASGIAGLGFLAGLSAVAISAAFNRGLLKITLHAIGAGLVRALSGDVKGGIKIIQRSLRVLGDTLKGEALVGKVAQVMKALKIAAKILTVLGIALDAILLIWEAIDGAIQREEFQKAIVDLCLRRLTVKKIQQYTRITLTFTSDAKAIVDIIDTFQDLVKDGTMTQEKADAAANRKISELSPKISTEINQVDEESVYKQLQEQDKASAIAWTNEDPSLEKMLKILENEISKVVPLGYEDSDTEKV